MTRLFNAYTDCPNCHTRHTEETAWGRWIRNNPRLESRDGFSVSDIDMTVSEMRIIHQFKGIYGREFQCMMDIECKVKGADLSAAQRDTLHLRNQLVRNRRQTPTKKLAYQAGTVVAYSTMNGRMVTVRHYGVHLLRFSGLGPDDSEWIEWDRKKITADQLTGLLRFDLDPDTLKPIDLRNHHAVCNVAQTSFLQDQPA